MGEPVIFLTREKNFCHIGVLIWSDDLTFILTALSRLTLLADPIQ